MTLELARKRRSQSELIRELVEALGNAGDVIHLAFCMTGDTGGCLDCWSECAQARALIEKAKLEAT